MKHQAKPGAALVVAGNMAIPGWEYYQYEYPATPRKEGTRSVPATPSSP